MAESYLQHAEHYFRLIAAAQLAQQQAQQGFMRPQNEAQESDESDDDDDFGGMPDRFASLKNGRPSLRSTHNKARSRSPRPSMAAISRMQSVSLGISPARRSKTVGQGKIASSTIVTGKIGVPSIKGRRAATNRQGILASNRNRGWTRVPSKSPPPRFPPSSPAARPARLLSPSSNPLLAQRHLRRRQRLTATRRRPAIIFATAVADAGRRERKRASRLQGNCLSQNKRLSQEGRVPTRPFLLASARPKLIRAPARLLPFRLQGPPPTSWKAGAHLGPKHLNRWRRLRGRERVRMETRNES